MPCHICVKWVSGVPFVPVGSFIEIRDEDGARWRYVFDSQTVRKVDGRVSFD